MATWTRTNTPISKSNALSLDAKDFAAWSPYNYVAANPVILVDSDGKSPDGNIYVYNVTYDDYGNKKVTKSHQYTDNSSTDKRVYRYWKADGKTYTTKTQNIAPKLDPNSDISQMLWVGEHFYASGSVKATEGAQYGFKITKDFGGHVGVKKETIYGHEWNTEEGHVVYSNENKDEQEIVSGSIGLPNLGGSGFDVSLSNDPKTGDKNINISVSTAFILNYSTTIDASNLNRKSSFAGADLSLGVYLLFGK